MEFRDGGLAGDFPQSGSFPETGGLIVEHDIITVGNAHEIVAPGHGQKACQIFNVVLVGLHVIGVAAVTAHRNTGKFAHEMVLKAGTGHLTCIVQILRADEADYSIHEERLVFFLEVAEDPTYAEIYEGSWLEENRPYGVVHRIASLGQGAGGFCLEWALAECGNIRIDTHEANLPMRSLLKKLGYTYCGMIYTHDGTPRLAYQKTR